MGKKGSLIARIAALLLFAAASAFLLVNRIRRSPNKGDLKS